MYANKLDNLDEKDKHLETNYQNWQQKKLNSHIPSTKETELVKKLVSKKSPCPSGFAGEFYQTSTEKLIQTLHKLFQKLEEEAFSFYEASYYPATKTKDNSTKTTDQYLLNTDAKFLNKILAICIWKHKKGTIHHNQVGFSPGTQSWFNIQKSM